MSDQTGKALVAAVRERAKSTSATQLHDDGWFALTTAKRIKKPAYNPKKWTRKVQDQMRRYLEGTDNEGAKLEPKVDQSIARGPDAEQGAVTDAGLAAWERCLQELAAIRAMDVDPTIMWSLYSDAVSAFRSLGILEGERAATARARAMATDGAVRRAIVLRRNKNAVAPMPEGAGAPQGTSEEISSVLDVAEAAARETKVPPKRSSEDTESVPPSGRRRKRQ